MRLWRISNYADLSGMGGVRFPARWHGKGRPILYTAEHPAGALTEFLVHMDLEDLPANFQLLSIEASDGLAVPQIDIEALPPDWTTNLNVTRAIGNRWLEEGTSLLLRVPSVLVPEAWNVLVNPAHHDSSALRLARTAKVPLDPRLIRNRI
jgi:RES domain-containing protein